MTNTRAQKGFTLTELLISVVIGILLLFVVMSSFTLNQRVLRRSNVRSELTQNGRIVLDLMSREIRQANTIVTTLPADDSDSMAIAHELQFEDGHVDTHIQYLRYYLSGELLRRQIIVYYFDSAPSTYVNHDDIDAFGSPNEEVLQDRIIGENFSQIDFFGTENITINLTLEKINETVELQTIINPRNN